MELDCLLLQICWAGVVLLRRLTEWRRFHFWFQPRDALNSGSSLNSFAFRRSINPLTAIPMQNEVRTQRRLRNDRKVKNLTRLEFVLTLIVKSGQWESFTHNTVTWYYDSFESHTFNNTYSLCNQLIDLFRDLVSVVLRYKINARQKLTLGSLLCKPFQYSLIELRIFGVKHPIVFRFADNLISPL